MKFMPLGCPHRLRQVVVFRLKECAAAVGCTNALPQLPVTLLLLVRLLPVRYRNMTLNDCGFSYTRMCLVDRSVHVGTYGTYGTYVRVRMYVLRTST